MLCAAAGLGMRGHLQLGPSHWCGVCAAQFPLRSDWNPKAGRGCAWMILSQAFARR